MDRDDTEDDRDSEAGWDSFNELPKLLEEAAAARAASKPRGTRDLPAPGCFDGDEFDDHGLNG